MAKIPQTGWKMNDAEGGFIYNTKNSLEIKDMECGHVRDTNDSLERKDVGHRYVCDTNNSLEIGMQNADMFVIPTTVIGKHLIPRFRFFALPRTSILVEEPARNVDN